MKSQFQEIRMLSQKIYHPIMYRVRLDRPVGHLVGCKKLFSSILVLANCFAKLCFLFGPRDRLLDVEKYLDFCSGSSELVHKIQQPIPELLFRSSHFSFLVFVHFWRRSYKNAKILGSLCLHFARQDGQGSIHIWRQIFR